jgi:hypothetical protein
VDELCELRAGDFQIVDLVSGASVSTTDARGCNLKKLKRESDWEFFRLVLVPTHKDIGMKIAPSKAFKMFQTFNSGLCLVYPMTIYLRDTKTWFCRMD